jgi:hypothetical protein
MHITSMLLYKLQTLAFIYTSFFLLIHQWYNDTMLRFLFFFKFLDELLKMLITNLQSSAYSQYSTKT